MFPILSSVLLVLWLPFEVIALKSTMYNGTLNTTVFGKPCQQWKSDSPHAHDYNNLPENYCRDPSEKGYLWCYTEDPKVRWDICDPRVLTRKTPYLSILSNTTGSACIKEVCCNITWKSFKNVEKCDPTMFVKLLINYRLQNGNRSQFAQRYVVDKYFKFIQKSHVGSRVDCLHKCLQESECNGFIYSGGNLKRCRLGKFNSPDAIKTLRDV